MMIQLIVLLLSVQIRIMPVIGQVAVVLETVGHTVSGGPSNQGTPYFALQRYDIQPNQDFLEVPRDRLRPGHYLMSALLIVNKTPNDPTKEHVATLDAVGFDETITEPPSDQ